jgi:hypothetical protein
LLHSTNVAPYRDTVTRMETLSRPSREVRCRTLLVGALTFAMLLLIPVAGWAADERGIGMLEGTGNSSCPDYMGAYATSRLTAGDDSYTYNPNFGAYLGWILGYASRVNEAEFGRSDWFEMKPTALAAWLASWCRDNPDQILWRGMTTLTDQRLGRR